MLPDNSDIQARVAVIHYQFGIELFNRAQFEKAELEFCNAIMQDATVAEYHVRKGDAARYLEKHEAACADYQRALQLNPHDQETKVRYIAYCQMAPQRMDQRTLTVSFTICRTSSFSTLLSH